MIGTCDRTWPSDRPTRTEDTYRRHRCGEEPGHSGSCRCRYCGREVR